MGCLTFRLKSLPKRLETASLELDIFLEMDPAAPAPFSTFDPLLLDAFHREPNILNDARTDLLRRRMGDGVESDKRRYAVKWSLSLFISITFAFVEIHAHTVRGDGKRRKTTKHINKATLRIVAAYISHFCYDYCALQNKFKSLSFCSVWSILYTSLFLLDFQYK